MLFTQFNIIVYCLSEGLPDLLDCLSLKDTKSFIPSILP
jgi:hypothetical protein